MIYLSVMVNAYTKYFYFLVKSGAHVYLLPLHIIEVREKSRLFYSSSCLGPENSS